jgi:hypothetical protein
MKYSIDSLICSNIQHLIRKSKPKLFVKCFTKNYVRFIDWMNIQTQKNWSYIKTKHETQKQYSKNNINIFGYFSIFNGLLK